MDPHRIGLVVFPGFQILDLATLTPFELANAQLGRAAYRLEVLSEHGGAVASSSGVTVESRRWAGARCDTVLVSGSVSLPEASPGLCRFLEGVASSSRRVASICTGAFLLGAADLLDGRRATTHWLFAPELQARHPGARVEADRIFVHDGPIWTSAGMTACMDLALALLDEDHGIELSRRVAQKMVVYHKRSGGQSQFSTLLELAPMSDRIQAALSHARANLRRPLSVTDLAEVVHLSPRQFSRAFKTETGQSPARAVEKLRVEAARELIEQGRHTFEAVAARTGFNDPERMRRAFLRAFGRPPQEIRRAARRVPTFAPRTSG